MARPGDRPLLGALLLVETGGYYLPSTICLQWMLQEEGNGYQFTLL